MSVKTSVKPTLSEILEKYDAELGNRRSEEAKKNANPLKPSSAGSATASHKPQSIALRSDFTKKHMCFPQKHDKTEKDKKRTERKPTIHLTPGSTSPPSTTGTFEYLNSDDDGKKDSTGLEDQSLKNEERSKAVDGTDEPDFAKKIEAMSAKWRLDSFPKPKNFYSVFFKKTK